MSNYNTKDIFLERRTANQTFEEYPLHVQPNSIVISDASGNLAMIDSSSFLAGTGSIRFAVSSSTADTASYLLGASNTASYALSASNAISASYALSASNAISASYALSASNAISSSYALTASYLNDFNSTVISGSDFTRTGTLTAGSTPLFFIVNPGETWVANAYLSAQSSNNRGMKYAISSSGGTPSVVEGWLYSVLNSTTTLARHRFTAINTQIATAVHTQAGVPGPDSIQLCVINPPTTTTISIAVAVTNVNDTVTVLDGAYMIARRVI